MDVSIGIGSGEPQELASLQQWLATQRGLAGRVHGVRAEPGAEELSSGAMEMVSVAVGSGGVLSVLAGALGAWLSSRRGSITITCGERSMTVPQGTDPAEIERLVRALGVSVDAS